MKRKRIRKIVTMSPAQLSECAKAFYKWIMGAGREKSESFDRKLYSDTRLDYLESLKRKPRKKKHHEKHTQTRPAHPRTPRRPSPPC
jgi:hypothetical protein